MILYRLHSEDRDGKRVSRARVGVCREAGSQQSAPLLLQSPPSPHSFRIRKLNTSALASLIAGNTSHLLLHGPVAHLSVAAVLRFRQEVKWSCSEQPDVFHIAFGLVSSSVLTTQPFPSSLSKGAAATMVLERLQQMASHVTGQIAKPHPLDPLSTAEIARAVEIIKREHSDVFFNAITIREPPKVETLRWLSAPDTAPRPPRMADCVCIGPGSKVYDALVHMEKGEIISWE